MEQDVPIASKVLVACQAENEAFQVVGEGARAEVLEVIHTNLCALQECVTEGGVTEAARATFARTGWRACAYGWPVEVLTTAWHQGYRAASDELFGAQEYAGPEVNASTAKASSSNRLLTLVAEAAEIAVVAYDEAWDQLPQVERCSVQVDDLLRGAPIDEVEQEGWGGDTCDPHTPYLPSSGVTGDLSP